jgi:hypothetical protein
MITGHKPHVVPAAVEPDRALSDVLDSLLTDEKDCEGRCILAYAPDAKLRSALQIRLFELQAGLTPARPADLARAVIDMLLGFGSARTSEEDAEAVVTQYVRVLAHLPLWAVQRACRRFASGSVTKTECSDWKHAYAPSTAQLCRLAEASVQKYWHEENRIIAALNGIPEYRPTEEERERVIQGFKRLQQELSDNAAAEIAAAEARIKQPLQPIATAVSPALDQAMRERDESEQWRLSQASMTADKPTSPG